MIKITEFIKTENIIINLKSKLKNKALEELINHAVDIKPASCKKLVQKKVLEREEKGSTALGHSIAVPHCRVKCVKDIHVLIGVSKSGIDFKAKDKIPVKLIVMIISNESKHASYLKLLSKFMFILKDREMTGRIISAGDPMNILEIIKDADGDQKSISGQLKHLYELQKLCIQLSIYHNEKLVTPDSEKKIIDDIIAEVVVLKEKEEKKIDRKILERFKAIQNRYGGIGILKIENGSCTGCNTVIPLQTINEVKRCLTIIQCEICGRILYAG